VKVSGWWWLLIAASAALWTITILPSRIDFFTIAVFTAPAAAIGMFLRGASCIFATSRWNWRSASRAALVGAMLLPPLLAALVTLAGLLRPTQLLSLFVIGAWIALVIGLLIAVLGRLFEKPAPPQCGSQNAAAERTLRVI
jgi:hypothetical protein